MDITRTIRSGAAYLTNRVLKRSYYDNPDQYWDDRHRANGTDLKGVGHRSLSAQQNEDDYEQKWHELRQRVDALAGPGSSLLDAGCGIGFFTMRFAELGYNTTGADFAATAIEVARENDADDKVNWIVAALDEIPTSQYDAVINVDVLYHIVDDEIWERSVRHMWSLVAPGGHLIIQESLVDSGPKKRRIGVSHLRLRSLSAYQTVLGPADVHQYVVTHENAHKDVLSWKRA